MLLIIRMLYFLFNIIIIVLLCMRQPPAIRRNRTYPENKAK